MNWWCRWRGEVGRLCVYQNVAGALALALQVLPRTPVARREIYGYYLHHMRTS
jgi:hypothetical protein